MNENNVNEFKLGAEYKDLDAPDTTNNVRVVYVGDYIAVLKFIKSGFEQAVAKNFYSRYQLK